MRHIPRPHVGSQQLKYVYEVRVQEFVPLRPLSATGGVGVLWTRGSKTAMTGERSAEPGSRAAIGFDEPLSLICTLFKDGKDAGAFSEKYCTFALVEQRVVGKLAGMRTLCKCKVDISTYALMDGVASAARQLELELTRNSQPVGYLRLLLSCRGLKDETTPSASGEEDERMSEMSFDESSEASSECSDAADTAESRLAELDDWLSSPSEPTPGSQVSTCQADGALSSACSAPQTSDLESARPCCR